MLLLKKTALVTLSYSDKIGADVVFLHGCPQSCMPNRVESLLDVCEDIVETLLVLEIFLTEDL